jgi:DNA-binding transcriptional MerR regulator
MTDHGKAPEAFRTIGEVSAALGIKPHVLRYWEEQFPTLRPVKRAGGRRLYRPEDVELIATIDRLVHAEGYTLRGARLAIEGGADDLTQAPIPAPTPAVVEKPIIVERIIERVVKADNTAILAQLHAIRTRLAEALAV